MELGLWSIVISYVVPIILRIGLGQGFGYYSIMWLLRKQVLQIAHHAQVI